MNLVSSNDVLLYVKRCGSERINLNCIIMLWEKKALIRNALKYLDTLELQAILTALT